MSGETDLRTILATLDVRMADEPVVYVVVPRLVEDVVVRAAVVEDEGVTLVLDREEADDAGLVYEFVGAWLTLTVRTALDAVGVTAAISGALADAGVPCNVHAGVNHDHLVVPWDERHVATRVLRALGSRRERE